ncbi:MAG: glycoside hydrolase family 3 C-terminal domain-containing protein [Treponema sp.]|nr:glycoside hydrolase family 3 C-terminal domain-containing protein [Treponema sp.]
MNISIEEKIRFFNGNGSWKTYTANGKIPAFFMSDGPHGLRKQDFENYADLNKSRLATCFPTASCIASSWDLNAAKELGQALAREAKAENVNLILGPGMNIKRSPLCGRNFEYFSEDPYLAGLMASACIKGIQEGGIGACAKHFACNNQEKRRQTSSSNIDEYTLRKIYLSAFEYVVKNSNPAAIMCSYNKVNGTYTCHNRHLLTEILREEWKYQGVVISDWGACIDAPKCLKAGMDLAMPDSFGYFDKQLKNALRENEISEKDLDRANDRLLNMINKYQISSSEPVDFEKQHQIALNLAEKSAVLLKNDGYLPILPEKSDNIPPEANPTIAKKITLIGELAEFMKFQGGGSSHITCANYPNAIESLTKAGFEVTYAPGYISGFCKKAKAIRKNRKLNKRAIAVAKEAAEKNQPIFIFCGLTDAYEGEGFDRSDLRLPAEQLFLINEISNFTQNLIIVSFSGAPVNLSPAKKARSILHMYLCGEACGQAVADLITGKVNPSGHLAESWPLRIEDTPSYKNFAPEGDQVNYEEKEFIGYRWYDLKKIPVLFPFGFGLSYTTFDYDIKSKEAELVKNTGLRRIVLNSKLKEVKLIVKNTGNYDGADLVHCYFNGELCGFTKVYLKKGQSQEVTVNCDYWEYDKSLIKEEKHENIFKQHIETRKFQISHSMGDMAQHCFRVKAILKILEQALAIMNKKPKDDPSVRIAISALYENPLESLISTSGGMISEKFARRLVKWANTKLEKKLKKRSTNGKVRQEN